MHHKSHIGDDADDVRPIAVVEFDGFVVTSRHQHFRPGALAEELLLLVERIADGDGVLLENEFVEQRQIGRVVPHGVLDQHDRPYALVEDIVLGVETVLYQFDDGDNQVGGVIPVKEIINLALVLLLEASVHLFAEGGKNDNRALRISFFRLRSKIPHFASSCAIDDQNEVKRQFL